MLFIDENTSKKDLTEAIYGDWDLLEVFLNADMDPEQMTAPEILPIVQNWIEEGDETQA